MFAVTVSNKILWWQMSKCAVLCCFSLTR